MRVLSIDNDFFAWMPGEDERFTVHHNGKRIENVHPVQLFDWGHQENGLFLGPVWAIREMSFKQSGLDLHEIVNVREDRGGVTYDKFAAEMVRLHPHITMVRTAESHTQAIEVCQMANAVGRGDVEVINFDAHHDLGYGQGAVEAHAKDEVAECGDWLYQAMRVGLVDRATIVYPDWREEERPGDWIKDLDVEWTSWSQWLAKEDGDQGAVMAFSCRSGAWAPPWLDEDWNRLCARLSGLSPEKLPVMREDKCFEVRT